MATLEEKKATLAAAGVQLDGTETLPQINALIKKTNNVDPAPLDETAKVKAPKDKPKRAVHFTLNSTATPKRSFTIEDHGEDFADMADEFAKTNENIIIGRHHE